MAYAARWAIFIGLDRRHLCIQSLVLSINLQTLSMSLTELIAYVLLLDLGYKSEPTCVWSSSSHNEQLNKNATVSIWLILLILLGSVCTSLVLKPFTVRCYWSSSWDFMSGKQPLLSRLICFEHPTVSVPLAALTLPACYQWPPIHTCHADHTRISGCGMCCDTQWWISIRLANTKASFLWLRFKAKTFLKNVICADILTLIIEAWLEAEVRQTLGVFVKYLFVLCWGWRTAGKCLGNYLKSLLCAALWLLSHWRDESESYYWYCCCSSGISLKVWSTYSNGPFVPDKR